MAFEARFLSELARLRELGREFSVENPSIAPFLAEQGGDPDVERLLEGFAFLSAMVRQKMDDEVPEFIGNVLSVIGPELVAPFPSATVLRCKLEGRSKAGIPLESGSVFASTPVDGTACHFSTSWPLSIQPVECISATVQPQGAGARLNLGFRVEGQTVAQWSGSELCLYLSGSYPEACNWLMLLRQHLARISISADDAKGESADVEVEFIGLDSANNLFPSGRTVAQHLRWIREMLAFPERAFFIRIHGIDQWVRTSTGHDFQIAFDFRVPVQKVPKPNALAFVVNAVPAVNLFFADANPIQMTYLRDSYQLVPMGYTAGHVTIQDVLSVSGRVQGNATERIYYAEHDLLSGEQQLQYQVVASEGMRRNDLEHHLRFPLSAESRLDSKETLSVRLRCSNGSLASRLRPGEISLRTSGLHEKVTVANVTSPTSWARPAMGDDAMWKAIGHARLNLRSILDTESLRQFLALYLPEGGGDPVRLAAGRRRLEGIESVAFTGSNRLVKGSLIQGQVVLVKLKLEYFASQGDLMLFGEILSEFFAGLVGLNSFVSLVVNDVSSGEQFIWPNLLSPGLKL
jgi:type VI secretion system protein ImpG